MLSDREKFCGIHGEVSALIIDFPIYSIHFNFSPSSKQGEVSQFKEKFSPRLSPEPENSAVKCFKQQTKIFLKAGLLIIIYFLESVQP